MAPTDTVTTTGHEETVDGVRMVFQMAPDTEAPSELLIHLPDFKALCAAEDATHNLHNLLTLRGALVRDPHGWSTYLTETIDLFGAEVEVAFASHHWPTWGNERVVEFLTTAARPVRLPARPDAADAEQGPGRGRDRRGDRAAAGPGERLEHPRLLRLGQPQRQGDLPALPRLVRRQPGPPVGAPAGREGQALRRRDRGHGRGRRPGARRLRRRRLPLGRRAGQPRGLRPSPTTQTPGACSPTPTSSSGYGVGERHLARLLPLRRHRAARRTVRDPDRDHAPGRGRPAHAGDALRRHRDPGRRPAGVGRDAQHRRAAHRHRRALPAAAGERRAHPQPPAAAGGRRRHADHHPRARSPRSPRAGSPSRPSPARGSSSSGDASVLGRLTAVLDPGDKDFAIVTP